MLFTILQYVFGIGIIQATLLGLVLLVFPGAQRHVSRLIGSVLLITAFLMGSELIDLFNSEDSLQGLRFYTILIDLLLVVLVWQLTNFILGPKKEYSIKDFAHLLPFTVGLIWLLSGHLWLGTESPGSFSHIPDSIGLFVAYKGLIWTAYMTSSIRNYILRIHQRSSISIQMKKRLFHKLIWRFIFILTTTLITFWMEFFGIQLPLDSDYIGVALIVLYIYFLTFSVLVEPKTFIRIKTASNSAKYARSGLNEERSAIYLYRLQSYMEKEEPFLDKKLKLKELADVIGLSPNQLSQVINEQLGVSFHDFINEYRLKKFKSKLSDPKQCQKTLLALAFESGFQSKASFNRVFKKIEGTSPSEYRQQLLSHPTF